MVGEHIMVQCDCQLLQVGRIFGILEGKKLGIFVIKSVCWVVYKTWEFGVCGAWEVMKKGTDGSPSFPPDHPLGKTAVAALAVVPRSGCSRQ